MSLKIYPNGRTEESDSIYYTPEFFTKQPSGADFAESRTIGLLETQGLQFPKQTIKGVANQFADLYSSCFESPWGFWAFSYLTCLGIVLANKVYLSSGNQPQPRLYTILLGRSGYERKSEAIRQTSKFFWLTFPSLFKECLTVGSAEGLIQYMLTNSNVLLTYDELNNFVHKCQIDGSVLLTCVTSLFEMNRYEGHTKKDSLKLENGYLSMLAACTTETFNLMWKPNFKDIGFINRLWLVPDKGEKKFSSPRELPMDQVMNVKDRTQKIVEWVETAAPRNEHLIIRTSPEADVMYQKWYMEQDQSVYNTRLDTYGDRLKVLFCLNEFKPTVDAEMMERIIILLNWQRAVREAYDPIDADNKVARIEEQIRRVLKREGGKVKPWKLKNLVNASRSGIWVFDTAIKNLMNSGEVEVRKGCYCLVKQ